MSENATTSKNNKSGIGVGSASIVLIFAVICLSVFTLITYIVASNHKALVDSELALVTSYYEADALAEDVLDWMLASGARSGMHYMGVDVTAEYNELFDAEISSFYCPATDNKSLYVRIYFYDDTFDVLSWRMVDLGEWSADSGINVWSGE